MSVTKQRQLRVENLEQRQMMAGDVAVEVVNGDLVITGDSQDNNISVYQVSNGDWVVSGFEVWRVMWCLPGQRPGAPLNPLRPCLAGGLRAGRVYFPTTKAGTVPTL